MNTVCCRCGREIPPETPFVRVRETAQCVDCYLADDRRQFWICVALLVVVALGAVVLL